MEAAWIRLSKVKGQIGGHVISGEPTAAPNLQFFANGIKVFATVGPRLCYLTTKKIEQ